MRVGFHRAFDAVKDQDEALELLVSLQFDCILTSGAAKTAALGAEQIKRLVERAGDRINVIAGGSITPENVVALVKETAVRNVHGRVYVGMAGVVEGL
jgi:copper homeostasis protein